MAPLAMLAEKSCKQFEFIGLQPNVEVERHMATGELRYLKFDKLNPTDQSCATLSRIQEIPLFGNV
jgi:hypothetical protein